MGVLAIVGAAVSVVGAAVSIWQVKAGNRQLHLAEEANKVAREELEEAREGRKVILRVTAKPEKSDDDWYLVVYIENIGQQPANIQAIAAVLGDGVENSNGDWDGEIQLKKEVAPGLYGWSLPAELSAGAACRFAFQEREPAPPRRNSGGLVVMAGETIVVPPDYENPLWRGLKGIRVRASNQDFWCEDGEWRRHFVEGYSSLNWKGGSTI